MCFLKEEDKRRESGHGSSQHHYPPHYRESKPRPPRPAASASGPRPQAHKREANGSLAPPAAVDEAAAAVTSLAAIPIPREEGEFEVASL